MKQSYLIAAVAALLLLFGGAMFVAGVKYQEAKAAKAAQAALVTRLKADDKAVTAIDKKQTERANETQTDTTAVAKQEPEWAGRPLPQSALDILRKRGLVASP